MVRSLPPPPPRHLPPPPPPRRGLSNPRRNPQNDSDASPLTIQKTATNSLRLSHILLVLLVLLVLFQFSSTFKWLNLHSSYCTTAAYSETPMASWPIQENNELATTGARGSSLPEYVSNYTGYTTVWEKQSFPCYAGEITLGNNKPTRRGFLYTKPLKSGSSTLSGIAIQTAINMAKRRKVETPHCLVRWQHATPSAKTLKYDALVKSESYLWTFIREPTKRTISQFFFDEVSRYKKEPHDSLLKNYMMSPKQTNYYFKEFSPTGGVNSGHDSTIPQILEMYDFIGIVERFDESLVVLKLLLGLEYRDILYLSAKSGGGYDDGVSYRDSSGKIGWDVTGKGKGTCVYIVPSFTSPGMKEWLESDTWKNHISHQNAMYAAANQSLDRTIAKLGKELVAEQLVEFKRRLKMAQEICVNQTVFVCSDAGVRNLNEKSSCLAQDSGCGYDCYNGLNFD